MIPITRAALAATATLLLAPAAAGAQMQVGFQSDGPIVDGTGIGREAALNHITGARGQWVRIIVQEQDWHRRSGQYRDAAAAAKGRGMKVMVTFMRWRGLYGTERPGVTAPEWRDFVESAVPFLAPYVDAWGSTNEPNHSGFAAHTETACVVQSGSAHSTKIVQGKRVVVHYRRVGRGRGKWARRSGWHRVAKGGTHRRTGSRYVAARRGGKWVHRVTFHHKRDGGWKRQVRRVALKPRRIAVSTPWEQRICTATSYAVAYRPIHDMTARVVRAVDPDAAMIAGDLSPAPGSFAFMEAFFAARPGPVDADAIGLHPYTPGADPRGYDSSATGFYMTTLERTLDRVRRWHTEGRLTGSQTWITEYGLQPSEPAHYWIDALGRAEAAGVPVMVLYELTEYHENRPVWDTGLLNRDGSPRPSWDAVTGWLASR